MNLTLTPLAYLLGLDSHLRLLDGDEEAAYLPQDGDGQPARAQLAGAEQHERQALHGVQHSGVGAALGRYLESRAGLQQLMHRQKIKPFSWQLR